MSTAKPFTPDSHVIDIFGSTKGRDQPIMLMEKAMELVSCLDESIFIDPNVVFFDPFCKAGEILLAAAMRACQIKSQRRLMLVNEAEIFNELYNGRYFGLAPDERHYLLSKRTFFGNKNSHDKKSSKNIIRGDYVTETDGKLIQKKFKKEFISMIDFIRKTKKEAKIVAVGNPPYQEADGGFGGSAKAIYNFFVEALIDSKDINEFVLVIPSRWFSAGKGLDLFRDRIIKTPSLKKIHYFKNSKLVFPTVDVLGGICFLHYKAGYSGPVEFIENGETSQVDFKKFDIILDDPKGYEIVNKVRANWKGNYVSSIAWFGKPFGIRTFYFKRNKEAKAGSPNSVACYSKGRKVKYVNRSKISKNADKIDQYKVAVPRAYSPGSKHGVRRVTLPIDQYFLVKKGEITAETYNIVGSFKTQIEAEKFLAYLRTDFARYLLGLRKITADIPKDRWDWVPLLDTTQSWNDEMLFNLFKINKLEREHIKKKVKEWS